VSVVGVAVVGVAVAEHLARRQADRRLRDALAARQILERQFGEVLASHHHLQRRMTEEQQRAEELSVAVASLRGQLEQTVGRLDDATRTVQTLKTRVATMQEQMDQLQGELALALAQRRQQSAAAGEGVQIERVVVSEAGAASTQGRVLSVHPEWKFVVLDFGWDAVRIGDTISIVREGHLLAKARVDRVQEEVCAATILPDWTAEAVRVNDLAQLL
jgi:hypothetical protein